MALITCENISLAYENNVVLSDLSFSVHTGDYPVWRRSEAK